MKILKFISNCFVFIVIINFIISAECYSQSYPFDLKYSKREVEKQRELFKNLKVKKAVIQGRYFDEDVLLDKNGKITYRESYQSGDKNAFDGSSTYFYNDNDQLVKITFESGDFIKPTDFYYDENGNVIKAIYDSFTEICTYDDESYLVRTQIQNVTNEYAQNCAINNYVYDSKKDIAKSESECCEENIKVVNYSYDENGNLSEESEELQHCKTRAVNTKTTKRYYNNSLNLPIKVEYINSANTFWTENISYEYYK